MKSVNSGKCKFLFRLLLFGLSGFKINSLPQKHWVAICYKKQHTRRACRPTTPLFPILQSIYADTKHLRKTVLARIETTANAPDILWLHFKSTRCRPFTTLDGTSLLYALNKLCKILFIHFRFSSTNFLNTFSCSCVIFSRSFLR